MPGFQVLDNVGGIATLSSMVRNHNCDCMVICGHYSFSLSPTRSVFLNWGQFGSPGSI